MENLPLYIGFAFGATTLLAIYFFFRSSRYSGITLLVLLAWLALQACLGLAGFYQITNTLPPRFMVLLFTPLVLIMLLFIRPAGRKYIDLLDPKSLVLLHIVRVPVELVLYALSLHHYVPGLITFEGQNFDILSGLTAPVIYYFCYVKKVKSSRIISLCWNFLCLGLLANVVIRAVLSIPSPVQQMAFDQPNQAVLYFPFVWLPACVVPLVLLSHLVLIRREILARK